MVFAIQIFQIIFYSIAIIFMGTLIFLGIWSFVTFNRMYQSQRIQNFLLDKIYQSISKLNPHDIYSPDSKEDVFNVDEFINEDELFNSSSANNTQNDDADSYDNNYIDEVDDEYIRTTPTINLSKNND